MKAELPMRGHTCPLSPAKWKSWKSGVWTSCAVGQPKGNCATANECRGQSSNVCWHDSGKAVCNKTLLVSLILF